MDLAVLDAEDVRQKLTALRSHLTYYAMYSSYLGGIVTDPALMVLPLDDHMCHRGHAVFDTTGVADWKLYAARRHVQRLLRSALNAKVAHSFTEDWILEVVKRTAEVARRSDAAVRMWISAGPGDFGLSPIADAACFYCVVTSYFSMPCAPLHEVTVPTRVVGMKSSDLAVTKSVCYLPNVLLHLAAKSAGGTYGIWVDESGFVKEGPISTLVAVRGTQLFSPLPTDTLPSCTVQRIFDLAPGLGGLVGTYCQLRECELYHMDELFFVGGDTHFFPIHSLNGKPIGQALNATNEALDKEKSASRTPVMDKIRAAVLKESVDPNCGEVVLLLREEQEEPR